jgi:hypothetical protein
MRFTGAAAALKRGTLIHTHMEGGVNAEVLMRPLGATSAERGKPAYRVGTSTRASGRGQSKPGRAPNSKGRIA